MKALTLSPVDIEGLPGPEEIFPDLPEIWHKEVARVLANVADRSTKPDAQRTITLQFGFVPEADMRSVMASVDKCSAALAATLPAKSRLLMERRDRTLRAVVRVSYRDLAGSSPEPAPPAGRGPGLEAYFGGSMKAIFCRELVRVLLNIDDPRTVLKRKRTINLKISFRAASEDERDVIRVGVEVRTQLASAKAPDPMTLYVEPGGRVDSEPIRHLPDGVGGTVEGKQALFAN